MQRVQTIRRLITAALIICLAIGLTPPAADAGVDDVLFGVTSSQTMIDFATISAGNFNETFTNEGTTTPSLTIGGNTEAQIGAMWTNSTYQYEWRQIRIIVDSNNDDAFTPFDYSDPAHPWNPPTENPVDGQQWTYTYPNDYPRTELRGQQITITVTVDPQSNEWYTDFPWDTWDHWWYEEQSDADKTDNWWMEQGQLMNSWWSGRDQNWNMLPNGSYKVQVWVDENGDGTFGAGEANDTLIIAIETASITGTVVDGNDQPVAGARVEAGSHMAWGETRTKNDGSFVLSGLQSSDTQDTSYHLRVQADNKVTYEQEITMPAEATTVAAGTLALQNAVAITGTLALYGADGNPTSFASFENQWGWTQYDLWVWIDGWNRSGPGWGNDDVQFEVGDGTADFEINIPPPSQNTEYQLNVNAEGYVATIYDDTAGEWVPISGRTIPVTSAGGDAGTIRLVKASMLQGSVLLPAAVTDWKNIDVQAINKNNEDERYWGWGNIDPMMSEGSTNTGNFRIDGIPAGSYRLEVRVMGYAMKTVDNVAVTQGQDTNVGQLTISEGSKITGTLTIQGDTNGLSLYEGDNSNGDLYIWLDAWSPSGGWGGTNLQVARGTDQSVNFSLGGLSDATYELHCWLGEGYELVDANSQSPVLVTVSGTASANLILKPHEGIIQGAVDFANSVDTGAQGVDLSHVLVEAKRPWDWMPPKFTAVDPVTGAYTISGLGTGDYVVKIGVYQGFMDWNGNFITDLSQYTGDGFLVPNSEVGVVLERTFVQNNASTPTTLNAALEQGYTISGTVAIDGAWHDFGDGAGGEPDGIKNTTADQYDETITMVADVAGQPVTAMPMEMMFMGGQDPRAGMIQADGTFEISGLAPGVYMVTPPFSSERITMLNGGGDAMGGFEGGQEIHHWTVTPQLVVVSAENAVDGDISGIDFTLANGHTVTGTITLPEAQIADESWDNWVGHLELETPQHQFMGHGMPLFKEDFNGGTRYEFTFHHVENGDYLLRFWTDRYVPGGKKFTVNNANATANLTIETGANLVGKLVDAETGEAVTGNDGVRVRCEAVPFVEGSWRETQNDDWSKSYIESGDDLMNGGTQEGDRPNNTPGKFHLTALPTGHKYVLVVEAEHGRKTNGAKNYVGKVIAGIEIPEGATGDINIGTIKLREGTTIQGRITDTYGNPVPGVEVFAFPSNSHDGGAEAEGITDMQGYYTVYGVDPDVAYYDMIAAEHADPFEDWGKESEWGEKRKYNVEPGTIDADFVLTAATATLSGTLTIPSGAQFMVPFKGEANDFPATMILLERKGVIYKDILDGIEAMSNPAPPGSLTTTYRITNIAPGNYKAIFMNFGLPTRIVDNVAIADGTNTLDVTWESMGATLSGALALPTGGYPTTADITGVVCMNTGDQSLTFGQLTQEADNSFSAYEVPGLAAGGTYQLVFYLDGQQEGTPEIFTAGDPVTVADLSDITYDAVISRNSVPVLMSQAVQSSNSSVINLGIFSTAYLNDDSISVVGTAPTVDSTDGEIFVSTGGGTLSNVMLSGDKRNITASYTKASSDDTVVLSLAVHYGDSDTTLVEQISFNVNTLAKNQDSVSVYIPGVVKLGNGDAAQIFVPAGALEDNDDGKATVTIEKTDEAPGALAGMSRAAARSRGIFARSATVPLPDTATAAGNQYDFSVDGASQTGAVTVQIQYDPNLVTDISELQIMHLPGSGSAWVQEDTNRIVDEDNHTISVEVTSLSPFMAAVVSGSGTDDDGGSVSGGSGGGGGGGCFISASTSEFTGVGIIFGLCLVGLLIGLRMIFHGSAKEEVLDKVN